MVQSLPQRLHHGRLPQKAVAFLSEDLLAAAGFDAELLLFQRGGDGEWTLLRSLTGETPLCTSCILAYERHSTPCTEVLSNIIVEQARPPEAGRLPPSASVARKEISADFSAKLALFSSPSGKVRRNLSLMLPLQ